MSWSTVRSTSTITPRRRMIPLLSSIRPSALLGSGKRFSVQLTNSLQVVEAWAGFVSGAWRRHPSWRSRLTTALVSARWVILGV
jgi:hypothetical protein